MSRDAAEGPIAAPPDPAAASAIMHRAERPPAGQAWGAWLGSAPAEVVRYYARLARLLWLGRGGADPSVRAPRWAAAVRSLRPEPEGDAMARLDFWTFSLVRSKAPRRVTLVLLALPLRALRDARRAAARYGGGVRRAHGIPIGGQILEMWRLQLRFPLAFANEPGLYYSQELYTPRRRADAGYVFGALHQNLLAEAVNGATDGVMDKRRFARRCAEAGLAHIPSLLEVERDGRVRWPAGEERLPPQDLFSKPALEANGTGAARWIRQPNGGYRSERGGLLDAAGVLAAVQAQAREGPVIVQPRLRNHPEVVALVGDTLATVRFASLLHDDGRWEPLLAIHRSARADAAVDNSARGGLACPVDPATGRLGRVAWLGPEGMEFLDTHPRTGSTVAGVRLPCWDEARSLVERAHRTFAEFPLIGWDVAITGEGPVLVEGNIIWNARSLQSAHRVALGRLPYAERLLERLQRPAGAGATA